MDLHIHNTNHDFNHSHKKKEIKEEIEEIEEIEETKMNYQKQTNNLVCPEFYKSRKNNKYSCFNYT